MFKPHTTVASVVVCENKFLMVEEIEDGRVVYNQPAGHLEANETIIAATKRELYEETGLSLVPQYLLGVYQSEVPNKGIQYLRFCYVIKLTGICPQTAPQDSDITAAHWFTLADIKARAESMRSPMVMQCIDDYLAGNEYALTVVQSS